MRSVWPVLVVLLMVACPAEKPVVIDAGPPVVEVIDAGPAVDAGPPPPSSLESTQVTATFTDGGTVALTSKAEIDPATALTISLPIKLKDFRIRLLDWREQIVVSDDELMADGRTYVITLKEPLKTGRGYNLTLDAELGPVITDDTGGTWTDWELAFRIAGEVQPEPSAVKKKPGKKKK